MSIALTDALIRQWAEIIPEEDYNTELGLPTNSRSDAELLARTIRAEESDLQALECVAQEMLNRKRFRSVFGGDHMSWSIVGGHSVEWASWREVLYVNMAYTSLTDGYHPLTANPMEVSAGNTIANTPISAQWRRACELAVELCNMDTLYESRLSCNPAINDQMYHRGYRRSQMADLLEDMGLSDAADINGATRASGTVKGKTAYQMLSMGTSIFFNDENSAGNDICNRYLPITGDPSTNSGIPTFTAGELLEFLKSRVGCGYTLGTYGQICTQDLLEKRMADDPNNEDADYLGSCTRWIGKLVTDCSGLIEWFLLKKGVTNCDTYSGGMYKQWCSDKSTNMSTMPRIPGVIVFKRGSSGVKHIGVYVGKDRIIEAKGKMYGVVVTQFSSDSGWNAWGMFDWLDLNLKESDVEQLPLVNDALTYGPLPGYPDIRSSAAEVVQHTGSYNSPVYRKGDSGDKIEMIRRRFWATDSSFIVSNFFDDVLEAKIKEFQTANSLTSDGIVGSGTWKVLFPVLKKRTGSQAGAREMQALLNYQNYPVGTPDGLFGTGTETVLKAYQQARQLDADGICGDKTWQSLTLEEPFETEVLIDQNGDSTALCELGDSNDVVRQLQQRLATQYALDVTGTYDNTTDQYVRAYQTANSITANGIVGPITWNKLFPILKMGRGTKDQVRALQMLLYRQKHGLLIDGVFGSGTQAAVKAYQTLRNLTSDGIVGANTWASLCLATPPAGNTLYFGTGGSSSGSNTIYRQGDTGTAVHQIKRRMAVENMFAGTVDATFDAELTYAVKVFQASEDVRVDGLVGPATWSLLFPIVRKQTGQQEGAKAVQALLNLNGYNVGTPDGLFGTGSENKLKQFQTANGLTSDGICGAATWAKLCEV